MGLWGGLRRRVLTTGHSWDPHTLEVLPSYKMTAGLFSRFLPSSRCVVW